MPSLTAGPLQRGVLITVRGRCRERGRIGPRWASVREDLSPSRDLRLEARSRRRCRRAPCNARVDYKMKGLTWS